MHHISHLYCRLCEFEVPWGEPAIIYIENQQSQRIEWGLPSEHSHLHVLPRNGYKYGVLSRCLCMDCLMETKLDLDESWMIPWHWDRPQKTISELDERKCRICSSHNILTYAELTRAACPVCREGILVKEERII